MKRFILFILVFVLVFSLSVTAYASSDESDWLINVLDYTTVSDENYFSYTSSTHIPINMPFRYQVTYVDMLFSYTGSSLTNVKFGNVSNQDDLTIVSLGNRMYRAYGNVSSIATFTFYLDFISSDTVTHYVTIYSLRVGNENTDSFPLKGSINYNVGGTWNYVPMTDSSTLVSVNLDVSYIAAYFACYDWQEYDRIDFYLKVNAEYIDSISCQIGYQNVPFTISKIYPGFTSSNDYDLDSKGEYFIYVSCDVSSFSRDLNNALDVHISGRDYLSASYNLTLYSVTGHVNKGRDPITFWLQRIFNGITSGFNVLKTWIDSQTNVIVEKFNSLSSLVNQLINGSTSQNNAADSFNDNIDDQSDELEDLTSDLNNVTRPPISDVNLSTDTMVKPNIVTITTLGIGDLLSNTIILRVFIMALTFALAGFILFGKR